MRVQVVLFDGFDPLDVLGPFEVFHLGAGLTGGRMTVELVSAEGPRVVPSGLEAVSLAATAALDPAADLVVVPGAVGALALDPEVDGGIGQLLARAGSSALAGPLRDAVGRDGTTVATVCGGSLLVAWAGLADGRPLVTHGHGADLVGTAARPVDARVVDDGDLVSAGNVTSGIDLALHLLEREVGPQVAHAVEQVIRHERRGTVWRADGGRGDRGVTAVLLSLHVLAAILAVGPVCVAASMFPPEARRAATDPDAGTRLRVLGRICRTYAVIGIAVPVLGLATALAMGVLTEAWVLVSIVLTAAAAGVLAGVVLPRQRALLEAGGPTDAGRRPHRAARRGHGRVQPALGDGDRADDRAPGVDDGGVTRGRRLRAGRRAARAPRA